MTSMRTFTIQQINQCDREQFVQALAGIFEGPPWIVNEAWAARPFSSRAYLHQSLCQVMYAAPLSEQITLIQSHPDLVGRTALAGTLSSASTGEQASAGLDQLTSKEITTFTMFNQAYHDRFGFPFVICARENKKESILEGFATRLHNSREQEVMIALGEIAKICALRLQDLIQP